MTSCKVAFLKSNKPDGWVKPIWIIEAPGLASLIALCLVTSNPTVSKIKSIEFSLSSGSFGFKHWDFIFFEQVSSLLLLGSDKILWVHFLLFLKLKHKLNLLLHLL